jgi:hypothetical protein
MKRFHILWALVLVFALASCATPGEGLPDTGETPGASGENGIPPAAALEAQARLAEELGISSADIQIVASEQAEWPDGCLGLGLADEICTQAIVPGWQITLQVNDQVYEVRTDEIGQVVRIAP